MYYIEKNFITEDEANNIHIESVREEISERIFQYISKKFEVDIEKIKHIGDDGHRNGYIKVENLPKGHDWHFDGCKPDDCGEEGTYGSIISPQSAIDAKLNNKLIDNHMAWCRYGFSILISPPSNFVGGEFCYMDKNYNISTLTAEDHYLSLVVHTGHRTNDPELHKVNPHVSVNGTIGREVILGFLEVVE